MTERYHALEIANFYIQMIDGIADNTIDNMKMNKLTHEKGSPWSLTYVENQNNVIPTETILHDFEKRSLDTFDISALNIPTITEVPLSWDTDGDNEVAGGRIIQTDSHSNAARYFN